MAYHIPAKPKLVKNSIKHQNKQGRITLTTQEWNEIINVLKEQTNTNTKYLSDLHASLWGNESTVLREPLVSTVNTAASEAEAAPTLPPPSFDPPPAQENGSNMWLEPQLDITVDLGDLDI